MAALLARWNCVSVFLGHSQPTRLEWTVHRCGAQCPVSSFYNSASMLNIDSYELPLLWSAKSCRRSAASNSPTQDLEASQDPPCDPGWCDPGWVPGLSWFWSWSGQTRVGVAVANAGPNNKCSQGKKSPGSPVTIAVFRGRLLHHTSMFREVYSSLDTPFGIGNLGTKLLPGIGWWLLIFKN